LKVPGHGKIILLACIALLAGCNKNKDGFLNRKYQNMVARFNVYFNGTQKLDESVKALENGHTDNYKEILSVYPYGTEENRKSQANQMDEIIKKASKVIADRPLSKWVDDAYLLMGKAYFFKADYFAAIETFQFINSQYKGSPMSYEATLWIIKSYVFLGKANEAEAIIGLLKNDPDFPKKHLALMNEVSALVYISEEKYTPAIEKMEQAIKVARGPSKKARFHYILGQLYEKQNNREKARHHYELVTRGSPPYEMAFNAKVNLARNYNPENKNEVRSARKHLRGMLKDDKNISFYDQILYELGLLEKNEKFPEKAIEYFKLSNQSNLNNPDRKALVYVELADIYFQRPDYSAAQAYYDSAVTFISPSFENYDQLKAKQEVLSDLIKNLILIHREDSLLKIADMSRKDIDALVEKTIREEKQKEEALKKEQERKKNVPQTNPMIPQTPFSNQAPVTSGAFYFDDPAMVSRGYNEFISRWGQRKTGDNWKYASLARQQTEEPEEGADPEKSDPQKTPEKPADVPEKSLEGVAPDKQKYYADIPFTKEAKDDALERVAAAYLRTGEIYYEQLKEYEEAAVKFEAFVSRFPRHEEIPKAFFYLHKIRQEQGNMQESDKYKSLLLSKHPESGYARFLNNNGIQEEDETSLADKKITGIYQQAYEAHQKKDYVSFFELKKQNDREYFGGVLQPKFELLAALAYAGQDSTERCVLLLEELAVNYPNSPEAQKAQQMLDAYKRQKSGQPHIADDSSKNVAYRYAPGSKHYFLFLIPEEDTKANTNLIRAKFTDFNASYQQGKSFSVENIVAGKSQMVLIKEFPNAAEAKKYLELVKSNKEFLRGLSVEGSELFIGDPKNVGLMVVNADVAGFRKFYQAYYSK
jgi:tetratricopeptide (TPR) repeat protein